MVPAAAAPLAAPAVAAAAAPAAAGVGLEALVKMFGIQGAIELLSRQVAKSAAPGEYATAPVGENRSNYFIGANPKTAWWKMDL